MGDFTFNQGNLNTVMLTVLTLAGTIPTLDRYTAPRLRISHVNGNGEIEDLAPIIMTQLASSNRWYYKYMIPSNAPFTRFLATFSVTFDGVETVQTEEFRVAPVSGGGGGGGSGAFNVIIHLENAATHQTLQDATVNIYDKNNPVTVIATAQTDPEGNATVFLAAGTYLAEFKKSGVISEIHTMVVDNLGNYTLDGD